MQAASCWWNDCILVSNGSCLPDGLISHSQQESKLDAQSDAFCLQALTVQLVSIVHKAGTVCDAQCNFPFDTA